MTGPIGGFFGLDLPAGPGGLARFWNVAETPLAWVNATSALSALIRGIRPGAVWLPGYICPEILAAIPVPLRQFFPLTSDLSPDLSALEGKARPGDLVLAVNMFGRAPGADWLAFLAAHPGVTFVEDCAQTIDSGQAPWGDWRLFSPRKLVGVPEGGLLAAISPRAQGQAADIPPPAPPGADDLRAALDRLAAPLARMEAPGQNGLWYPQHQQSEAAMRLSDTAMSRLARLLLDRHDPRTLTTARQANFRALAAQLADLAVLDETDPAFAPFGFPVALSAGREAVLTRLYAQGIFPAVHWRDIPAPMSFAADHARARQWITLPCDQRYGPGDMDRVAQAFRESLP